MKKLLALAWRQWRRDSRTGELRVLAAALVLAVASVGTVGLFADRVKAGLSAQANVLLGADLLITADRPLPPSYADEAKKRGLAVVESIRFNSMVATDAAPVLADVKAVDPGYPLRGQILLEDAGDPAGRATQTLPQPGAVWIDQRMRVRLGAKVGDKIQLGDAALTVQGVIQQEPEMSGGFLALSPKVLMTMADLPATNLLQPGNRASYRLLLAGAATDQYRGWLLPKLAAGQRVENIRDLRPEVKSTLDRAEKFLGLSALVAVLLAAVAVALAARRYLHRQLDAAGVMRCLGASQGQVLALYVLQFAWLGIAASLIGCIAAIGGQQVLALLLKSLFKADLPWAGSAPIVSAFTIGIVLLFGFALPPLIALSNVPPLRVLRRDLGAPGASGVLAYVLGIGVVAALIFWQAGDTKTGLIMLAGIGALLVAALVSAWLLLKAIQRIPQRGYSWRYGLANLRRRPLASCLQIGALGLGLMALLLLSVVRVDLLHTWQSSLPPDAPNKFLINVQPEQAENLAAFLSKNGVGAPQFSPMIRGRLVAINGKMVNASDYPQERAKRLIEREFNLSWASALPPGNRIVGGKWWDPGATGKLSLEDGIAETLKLKVGDQLTYDIAGQQVSAEVANLRKVDWDSFRVNFFALATPVARGQRGDARRARADLSQRAVDRRHRNHAPGADDHGPGVACGRVRVPVHVDRRDPGIAGSHRVDAGRASLRHGNPAHPGRADQASARGAADGISGARIAGRRARRRGRLGGRLGRGRKGVADSVPVQPDGAHAGHRRGRCRGDGRRMVGDADQRAAAASGDIAASGLVDCNNQIGTGGRRDSRRAQVAETKQGWGPLRVSATPRSV